MGVGVVVRVRVRVSYNAAEWGSWWMTGSVEGVDPGMIYVEGWKGRRGDGGCWTERVGWRMH